VTGYAFAEVSSQEQELSDEDFKQMTIASTESLLWYQNMLYILVFIFFQLVFRDKPDVPPSAVAAAPIHKSTFCDAFKVLWADKNFLALASSNALVQGAQAAIAVTMSNLLNPFGYSMS